MSRVKTPVVWPTYWVTYLDDEGNPVAQYQGLSEYQKNKLINTTEYVVRWGRDN